LFIIVGFFGANYSVFLITAHIFILAFKNNFGNQNHFNMLTF